MIGSNAKAYRRTAEPGGKGQGKTRVVSHVYVCLTITHCWEKRRDLSDSGMPRHAAPPNSTQGRRVKESAPNFHFSKKSYYFSLSNLRDRKNSPTSTGNLTQSGKRGPCTMMTPANPGGPHSSASSLCHAASSASCCCRLFFRPTTVQWFAEPNGLAQQEHSS